MNINPSHELSMFPLPKPKKTNITTWQGIQITKKGILEGFTVVYPGEVSSGKIIRCAMKPKYTFILKHGDTFKYAYNDGCFKEIPEKWYKNEIGVKQPG